MKLKFCQEWETCKHHLDLMMKILGKLSYLMSCTALPMSVCIKSKGDLSVIPQNAVCGLICLILLWKVALVIATLPTGGTHISFWRAKNAFLSCLEGKLDRNFGAQVPTLLFVSQLSWSITLRILRHKGGQLAKALDNALTDQILFPLGIKPNTRPMAGNSG